MCVSRGRDDIARDPTEHVLTKLSSASRIGLTPRSPRRPVASLCRRRESSRRPDPSAAPRRRAVLEPLGGLSSRRPGARSGALTGAQPRASGTGFPLVTQRGYPSRARGRRGRNFVREGKIRRQREEPYACWAEGIRSAASFHPLSEARVGHHARPNRLDPCVGPGGVLEHDQGHRRPIGRSKDGSPPTPIRDGRAGASTRDPIPTTWPPFSPVS